MKKYQQVVVRFGSCISVKITSFCLLRTKLEMGLERRGVVERRRKKHIPQKEFLINSEVQNSLPRMSSLSREENFTVLISI